MKRTRLLFLAGCLALTAPLYGGDNDTWLRNGQWGDPDKAPELWNSPEWVTNLVEKKDFDRRYRFTSRINPFYLRGDFNGDGKTDIAVLIKEIKTGKQGIAVLHYGINNIIVIGAGNALGNGGDDFSWMDLWHVQRKGKVEQGVGEGMPPKLRGEALYIEKSESASALIYWTGRKYQWYQQGD